MSAGTQRVLRILCLGYVLLIVYGSLFPFLPLHPPQGGLLAFLHRPLLQEYTRKRIAENLFIYIPFGFLLVAPDRRLRGWRALLPAGGAGAALSLAMEFFQQFVPGRHASLIDAMSNTSGTILGAALALVLIRPTVLRRWLQEQRTMFRPGHVVDAALGSVFVWVLSEWSPFIPVMSRAALKENLRPAGDFLTRHWYQPFPLLEYACYMTALIVLLDSVRSSRSSVVWRFGVVAGVVLLLKPMFRYQMASVEALAGLAIALLLSPLFLRLAGRMRWAMLMLVAGFTLHLLQPHYSRLTDFNFLPFRYQTNLPIDSVPFVVARLWPFLSLGCLAVLSTAPRAVVREAISGGLGVVLLTLGLEWWQHTIHVWFGDITTVVLAVAGWTVPWLLWVHDQRSGEVSIQHPA